MSLQCKIFKSGDIGILEGQINNWLSDTNCFNKVEIYKINQSIEPFPNQNPPKIIVTIFYEIVKK